jgi:hypothetical protein
MYIIIQRLSAWIDTHSFGRRPMRRARFPTSLHLKGNVCSDRSFAVDALGVHSVLA